jgi:uncharacterized repeat protein (TIGR02543 family)
MKRASILRGIFGLALLGAVIVVGCDNATNGGSAAAAYTVTFAAGEGSGTAPAAVSAAENASITLPGKGSLAEPAAGRDFLGWTDGTNNYSAGDSYTVKGTATHTARWKPATTPASYTGTFDADGGTGSTTKTVTPPSTSVGTLPADPTKTGNSFGGWFTAKNGGGTQFTATSAVAADITVYAKWEQANPLVGAWVDDKDNPYELELLSADNFHFRVTDVLKKEANYDPLNNPDELRLSVSGISKAYTIELKGNSLIVEGYKPGQGTNPATDITFTRILGSATAGVYGAWYTAPGSGVSSENQENTLLVIQKNNKVLASFDRDVSTYDEQGNSNREDTTGGNWVRWNYSIVGAGTANTYILWPDTPDILNRYRFTTDNKLEVSWDGEPFTAYEKLEL